MSTKTETKHTPGPWRISDTGEIYGAGDIHAHGRLYPAVRGHGQVSSRSFTSRVCVVEGSPELEGPAANARLIAAAPELLEACKAVMRLDYLHEHNALAKQVEAAIRKAQGDL